MINLTFYLALIYLGNNVFVWNILRKPNNGQINSDLNAISKEEIPKEEKNKTHTFLDDEEFMYILRFYRPM